MRCSSKDSKKTRISSFLVNVTLLLVVATRFVYGDAALPPGAKFEVVSVRVLSEQETIDRSPDFIGADVAVRLRLSCSALGFYFYAWGDDVTPVGYSVKMTDQGLIWRNRMPSHTDSQTSPGIGKLNAFLPGVWRLMSGHVRPTIEWEQLDSTAFSGEKHAFTAFIRKSEHDKPIEIVSDPYVVPAGPALSR